MAGRSPARASLTGRLSKPKLRGSTGVRLRPGSFTTRPGMQAWKCTWTTSMAPPRRTKPRPSWKALAGEL